MPEPKKWTPSDPLPDEDAETEAHNNAMKRARENQLYEEFTKPKEKEPKKTKKWGD